MSLAPGPRPTPDSLAHSASRPLLDVLLDLVAGPQALAFCGVAWAEVLWLATQIPQRHAATAATDGLARPEVLALHALGLDALAWSLAVCLLAGLSGFAAIAAGLSGRLRWRAQDLAVALAGACAIAGWAQATADAPPVALDVAVGSDFATVPAWRHDGGGAAPAPGRWQAACKPQAGSAALACTVVGEGLRHQVSLAPGVPAVDQGQQLTWLATAPAPQPQRMTLNWHAKPPPAGEFALGLEAGVAAQAPALNARLLPYVVPEAGPLLLVTNSGPAPTLRVLASPDVLPLAPATATVDGPPLVRLQVAPHHGSAPFGAACLLLAAVFAWQVRRPAAGGA